MRKMSKLFLTFTLTTAALTMTTMVAADSVPRAHVASPDVYKVLAETDDMRVLLATWKPGQQDKMHSHPILAAFSLTDCHFRIFKADGSFIEKKPKAKKGARIKGPIKKHAFKNIGKTTCETLIVERK